MAGLTERERALREERQNVYENLKPLIEKIKTSGLEANEQAEFDRRNADLTRLGRELQNVIDARNVASDERQYRDEPDFRGARGDEKMELEERQNKAFSAYLRYGAGMLSPEQRSLLEYRTGPDGDAAPMNTSQTVSITGGTSGGYGIPPAFWRNLQIALKAYGGVYPHFQQVNTRDGAPMSWTTTNPTTTVAALISTENTQLTPQDETFGLGQLYAWTYAAGPFLASVQLVNDFAFDVDSFLRDRIAEAIGRAQAAAAWSGTGSSEPLGLSAALASAGTSGTAGTPTPGTGGIFVAGTAGGYKVNTFGGGTTPVLESVAGAMSFQTVFQLISVVDPAYRGVSNAGPSADETSRNPAWYMSDTTLQAQRQVTDLYGRPMIQQSVNMGGNSLGDTLGGYPVVIDNNAPAITGNGTPSATNASGPVFGSLHHAMVARNVQDVRVMRLNERFADYLSVAWLGYMRFDSRSNDLRAVAQKSYGTA